ncbi:hypothetical protein K8640_41380 [Myxococcus sp. XM-1-1-1]|uniref:hypothetical protein n=1 Tax=Myxococcus sp. XM-1-1-1 TaxID=2874602 RepID=UPI001CBB6D55|nr:hypothetical protein [Myxococcus sp. XM-1-1-1]MBZ4414688.1 hypothetical protein [Myxococcus sp. XM-1-1-1]
MIHAFALEPEVVATWGRREEFRFIHDKFGLGTPRVLLELPAFSKWKKAVYNAARALDLSQGDMKRIEELFRLFGEHKHRRANEVYDDLLTWLANAEHEWTRSPFAGIVASQNPRNHEGVLVPDQLDVGSSRWACEIGASPSRTPKALALALSAMVTNCRQLHLVDPHFGPENARHRMVLEALMGIVVDNGLTLDMVRVHCKEKSTLEFFEQEAAKMAARLPSGVSVEFVRWRQKAGGDKLHNRYVLTDVGGVSLGVGLDAGGAGETDDLLLLPRAQYALRWGQYVEENGSFECADRPAIVVGTRTRAPQKGGG